MIFTNFFKMGILYLKDGIRDARTPQPVQMVYRIPSVQHDSDFAHLHPIGNVPTKYQCSKPYFPRYTQDKILKVKVTMTRLKVKSRPHQDVAHQGLSNVNTKYHLPLNCAFKI